MKANRIRICGRKITTPPRPAMTPSASRLASGPGGSVAVTHSASPVAPASIRSITGAAQAYTAWKIRNMIAASSISPNTGCSTTRSSASSIATLCTGNCTATRISRRVSACRSRSDTTAGADGVVASMAARNASAPWRFTAIVSITGMPSSACSLATSIRMPRRAAASIMFRASTIGRPSWRTSSTKRRCRRRLVASATQTSRSGLGSAG